VLFAEPGFKVSTCAQWHKEVDQPVELSIGAVVNGRGREWVVLTSEPGSSTLEETFEEAKKLGDGAIAGVFGEHIMALVHRKESVRDYEVEVPEGYIVKAPVAGRFSKTARREVVCKFMTTTAIGNMTVEENIEISFEEVVRELPLGEPAKMLAFVGNAKLKGNKADNLQKSALKVKAEITNYAKLMKGNNAITHVTKIEFPWPAAFLEWVPQIVGYYYSLATKSWAEISLDDAVNTDHYMQNTLMFIGEPKTGKSRCAEGVGQRLTMAHDLENVVITKGTLQAFGMMTRAGTMSTVGCFVFHDFDMMAYQRTLLSLEERKGFFKIEEDACFAAPHHPAVMPKLIPRIITANTGGTSEAPDWGSWFERQKLTAGAHLARKDLVKLNKCSADERAYASSITIFRITEKIYTPATSSDRQRRFASRRQIEPIQGR